MDASTILNSGEVKEQDLEKIADILSDKGLSDVALFMIEAHLPLAGIFSNLCIFGAPFLDPFFGSGRGAALSEFFGDPEQLDKLSELIEEKRSKNPTAQSSGPERE